VRSPLAVLSGLHALFPVPLGDARPNNKSTMTECNQARCLVVTYLVSFTSDEEDRSSSCVDSHYESFMLGMGEHGRVFISNRRATTTIDMLDDETLSKTTDFHIVVLFVSLMINCIGRELLLYQNSDKISWQGAYRAVLPCCRHGRFTGLFHRSIMSNFKILLRKLLKGYVNK
jgi:hypothetical protein